MTLKPERVAPAGRRNGRRHPRRSRLVGEPDKGSSGDFGLVTVLNHSLAAIAYILKAEVWTGRDL